MTVSHARQGDQVRTPYYNWKIELTAPVLSWRREPGPLTNTSEPIFSVTANETITNIECQLDGSGFSPCEARNKLGPLTDGLHTFEIKATDLAGNPSNVLSSAFTVDATAPETTIDSGPSGTSGAGVSFEFSSNEPGSFQCRLDADTWGTCSSPKDYNGLADGKHTFRVRAVDLAGNKDGSAAKRSWTVSGG